MADYVDKSIYGWSYYFSCMMATISSGRYLSLEVRDGEIGWTSLDGVWVVDEPDVQEAYSKWLDKQIYGDANG